MKQQFDSIIFDMDGVLVSNASYRRAIQMTVESVLLQTKSIKINVSPSYIETIKTITGFNNDWDTSYALINLLGNGVSVKKFREQIKKITPTIRESEEYKKVKNIFQMYYLGTDNDGYIANETRLISLTLLKQLSRLYVLGIATSRPTYEAQFAANNLGLAPTYIPAIYVVAKEDAAREKPFPDPLLEAKKRMNVTNPIYVGDTINDTEAAKQAGMKCVFVGTQKLGDIQITNINQLQEVLL